MKNFEEDLNRLEELTQAIKKSDITIEEALKDFEEGIKLAKGLQKELDNIEGKVQILMKEGEESEENPSEEEDEKSVEKKEKTKSKSKKTKEKSDASSGPELSLFDINTEVNGTRNA